MWDTLLQSINTQSVHDIFENIEGALIDTPSQQHDKRSTMHTYNIFSYDLYFFILVWFIKLIILCFPFFRDLIRKLLVQDRTRRLGNMRVSEGITAFQFNLKHYD